MNNPDHTIYITNGSKLMIPHPRADELLERLDYILFAAAHRDGDPFAVPPVLDASGPAVADLPLAPLLDDGGFDTVERVPLAVDGGLWVARLGQVPGRLTTRTRKFVEQIIPVAPAPVAEEAPLLDNDEFAPVRPRALPVADGAVWIARTDFPMQEMEGFRAQI